MKTIETSLVIAADPAQVWDTLIDFPQHARWNPFFASIDGEAVVGATLVVTARKGEGTGMTFKPTVLDVEPGRLLRWKGQLLIPGIFDGTHEFRLEAHPEGTMLHHNEAFRGLLIPFTGKLLRETEEGFHAFNQALAAEVADRIGEPSPCATR